MDGIAITATLAGLGTIIGIFLKYISGRDKSQETRDKVFAEALNKLTRSNEKIAKETAESRKVHVRGLAEAERRNGHLAELQIEGKASNDKNSLLILKAISNLPSQHVKTQVVDKQTVNETTKE